MRLCTTAMRHGPDTLFRAVCLVLLVTYGLVGFAQSDVATTRSSSLIEADLAAAEASGDSAHVADLLAELGQAYFLADRLEPAQKALGRAAELARNQQRSLLLGAVLNDLGNVFTAQRDYDQAQTHYRQAAVLAERNGDNGLLVNALLNASRNLQRIGDRAGAAQLLAEVRRKLEALPEGTGKTFDLLTAGQLSKLGGNPEQAYRQLQQALKAAEAQGDPRLRSYAYGYLAELYAQSERNQDARWLVQKALFLAQQIDAPDLLYLWHWQAARLYQAQGEAQPALADYRLATAQVERIRDKLIHSYHRRGTSFRDELAPLFLEQVDLLLRQAPRVPELRADYLRTARNVMESLNTTELQDYFLDECVAAARARATAVDQISADTGVLYPIALADRVELLLSSPAGIKQFTVPIAETVLTTEVQQFRYLLEKRTSHEYLPYAKQLYDWLLRPMESTLQAAGIDTLVVVPGGILRTIPWSALHDGQRFAIERYAFATVPGLTLTDASPLPRLNVRLLLNGLSKSVQGFSPLPAVPLEIENIRRLFEKRNVTLLEDQTFVLDNLEAELTGKPYAVVHIASHGRFNRNSRDSFLLTYREKITLDRLEEYMRYRRYSEEPIELLTLSACQTAAGDEQAALGLAGVAIKAGARSVVGTLWYINDEAAPLLLTEFYRQLQDGHRSKAKALQLAQLHLLENRIYRHPSYWSPFLLIGNWL